MAAVRQPQTAAALSPAEMELKSMWQEAELEFGQLTRRSLRTDREKRLDDVLAELDKKYRAPEDTGKKAKFRATVAQVLSCIQLLGGLAAEGASIVFGPATLCFNAISFLIDVPGKIASVYEGVGSLFEEISHFLVLFKIYGHYTTLDPELRDGIHKLMMSMIRICGLSIKIIEGGLLHHIKIGAKVTFLNDDSGVRAELDKFKALIGKQSNVTEAVTLQHVLSSEGKLVEVLNTQYENAEKLSNLEGNMNIVVADVTDRRMQVILSERVEQMATMLSMTRDSAEEARKLTLNMIDNLLPGSGQWLLDDEDYKEWKSPLKDTIPLLLLSGDPKTGKSSLLASIEKDLRITTTTPDVAIAYHTFTGRDAKGSKDKNKDELVFALKSMALQLAGQYRPYAKEMAALKEGFKPPEVGKEKDPIEKLWWDKLHFSRYSQTKDEANFVLVFDGLDELSETNRARFLKLIKTIRDEARTPTKTVRQHMRIIAAGDAKVFENRFETIEISARNSSDISLYIEEELKTTEALQGQHAEMLALLQEVRESLPAVAQGSFSVVQQKLERIKEAVDSDAYLDDVRTILWEDPAEDSGKLAKKVLGDLNASLNAHEIAELSVLLHWCVFGFEFLTTDELRATVFLNTGKSSLQPFERKLRKKYTKVLKIEGDQVLVEPEIARLFTLQGSSRWDNETSSSLDNARITMTVSINQADVRTVQQFFWDLTERVGIGKFDFLTMSNNDSKGTVRTDRAQAHYHITEQLLRLLNDEPHEKTQCLVPYAMRELPSHLKEVYDSLGTVELEATQRRNIAKSLVDLLADVEGIERFWSAENVVSWDWLEPKNAAVVENWLTDSNTVTALQPRERRWVRNHTASTEGKGGVFKPITLMVARRWLRDRTWWASSAFMWIHKYLLLVGSIPHTRDVDILTSRQQNSNEVQEADAVYVKATIEPQETVEGTSGPESIAAPERSLEEDVFDAAAWVQQALSLNDANLDALWYERIAETFAQNYEPAAAKQQCEKAKDLGGGWSVDEIWAVAVENMSQDEGDLVRKEELRTLACSRLETVVEHLRSSFQTPEAEDDARQSLVRNLVRLADWQAELKCLDRAFTLYEEALAMDQGNHFTRGVLLKAIYAEQREEEARNMLARMVNQKESSSNLDLFAAFLLYLAVNQNTSFSLDPLTIIIFLGQPDKAFNSHVLKAIETAIADIRGSNAITEGVLLLYQGVCLARGTSEESHIQQAIRCWDDCQSLYIPSSYDLETTREMAARFVAQHFFHQARNPEISPEEREQNFRQLLRVNRPASLWPSSFQPTSYLASYYVLQGQVEEARKLFREDMIAALVILSDHDPDNDVFGYKTMANILMHTGDDLNALSAWSLLGPDDVFKIPDQEADANRGSDSTKPQELEGFGDAEGVEVEASCIDEDAVIKDAGDRNGPISYSCDGFCEHNWWYANDLYVCRYCPDTQFTEDCVQKLKANKLERYICDPGHSWLHVPKWSDQDALEVGQGKVRAHGQLVDGKRVGGDIVEIQQWLNEIRGIWRLPKLEEPVT
ncbi:hypothetical protein A1O7_09394 [Cladophialophora yegresii CBS 114405]|uniref:Uncharacterized protein n=1 Tax=Cladophialophora yegresii CBS 114405 TaxID=1182544 RepID=W9VEL0_9EURO|nr:uncharacterized protein A1O7_09394 [Cladophialophora yegresii CBS 114405]EXJ54057.1 hypothetical protein A1O7_09394 [Cladophialophora yegresii CBS 114405]